MDDLPAAHSMDTTWYAVDEHGHVGRFDTGEDGALPEVAAKGVSPVEPSVDYHRLEEHEAGMFHFGHDHGDDPGRYTCDARPEQPLHVGQLEPELAAAVRRLMLPVDFRQGPVHLADHPDVHAETWGDLPLRYTEEWSAQQQARIAQAGARKQGAGGGTVLLVVAVALALLGWLVGR